MSTDNGLLPEPHMPVMVDVFCPEVGWTISRDGFCYDCGATAHETAHETSPGIDRMGAHFVACSCGWESAAVIHENPFGIREWLDVTAARHLTEAEGAQA